MTVAFDPERVPHGSRRDGHFWQMAAPRTARVAVVAVSLGYGMLCPTLGFSTALAASAAAASDSPEHCDIVETHDVDGCAAARQAENLRRKADDEVNVISKRLDREGRALLEASVAAYDVYVDAMAQYSGQAYWDGTIGDYVVPAKVLELSTTRLERLRRFWRFVAQPADQALVAGAEACANEDCERACSAWQRRFEDVYGPDAYCFDCRADWRDRVAELLGAMHATEQAWATYRNAEVALYVHVFGSSQGADNVRSSLLVDLASHRQQECKPTELGGAD